MYDVGEIARLCLLARPQVGVVTNVGPVHLERLGTIERMPRPRPNWCRRCLRLTMAAWRS